MTGKTVFYYRQGTLREHGSDDNLPANAHEAWG